MIERAVELGEKVAGFFERSSTAGKVGETMGKVAEKGSKVLEAAQARNTERAVSALEKIGEALPGIQARNTERALGVIERLGEKGKDVGESTAAARAARAAEAGEKVAETGGRAAEVGAEAATKNAANMFDAARENAMQAAKNASKGASKGAETAAKGTEVAEAAEKVEEVAGGARKSEARARIGAFLNEKGQKGALGNLVKDGSMTSKVIGGAKVGATGLAAGAVADTVFDAVTQSPLYAADEKISAAQRIGDRGLVAGIPSVIFEDTIGDIHLPGATKSYADAADNPTDTGSTASGRVDIANVFNKLMQGDFGGALSGLGTYMMQNPQMAVLTGGVIASLVGGNGIVGTVGKIAALAAVGSMIAPMISNMVGGNEESPVAVLDTSEAGKSEEERAADAVAKAEERAAAASAEQQAARDDGIGGFGTDAMQTAPQQSADAGYAFG